MTAIKQLISLLDEYQRVTDLTDSTVSTHVFNDGKKLGAIRSGGDLSTGRYQRVLQHLSNIWPEQAHWPANIERPPAERKAAA